MGKGGDEDGGKGVDEDGGKGVMRRGLGGERKGET